MVETLAEICRNYQQKYPRVQIALHTATADTISEMMNKGLVDIGLFMEPVDTQGLDHIRILGSDRWVVGMRPDDPLASREYIEKKNCAVDFLYKVFVCNHCFETWLLGNGNLYPDIRPEGDFQPYYDKYNIKVNDPELMAVPDDIKETIAVYHFHYLHEMCRYNRVRYSKKKPMEMAKKVYFDALVSRIDNSDHLHSFAQFYEYFVNEQK